MSRQLTELQTVLAALIAEHHKLLAEVAKHQAAINSVNAPAIDAARASQEAIRSAIVALDLRRQSLTDQIALPLKLKNPTLTKLAELHPQFRPRLLALRDELRSVIVQISQRNQIAGRVAHAVLGHLNTVVRILAGAMHQAGLYTNRGVPKMAARVGVIETVG